jgi:hypothetical protein
VNYTVDPARESSRVMKRPRLQFTVRRLMVAGHFSTEGCPVRTSDRSEGMACDTSGLRIGRRSTGEARPAQDPWARALRGRTALTVLTDRFKGLARHLETLFTSLGKSLAAALVAGIADLVNNPIIDAIGQIPIFAAQVAVLKAAA